MSDVFSIVYYSGATGKARYFLSDTCPHISMPNNVRHLILQGRVREFDSVAQVVSGEGGVAVSVPLCICMGANSEVSW